MNIFGERTQQYFSAFSDKEQFVNAVTPFTTLHVAKRFIAEPEFFKAKDQKDEERDLLRFFITDYLKFHKANFANDTSRLVYRPRDVGNGDRFDCMFFAYWAAVLSRRVFVLDWREPFPLSLFFKSASGAKLFMDPKDSFSLSEKCPPPECILLTHLSLNESQYESVLLSKVRTVLMHTHKIPLQVDEAFFSRHLPDNLSPILAAKFRNSQTFRRAVMHHVLTASDSMMKDHTKASRVMRLKGGTEVAKTQKTPWFRRGLNNLGKQGSRRYIGVHARLGKGVGEFPTERFKHVALRLKDVANCLASRAIRISEMSGSPPLPIFLATDTSEFRDVFERTVRQISGDGVDVLYGNWSMIHVAKVPFKDKNYSGQGSGKPWEAVWGGFMDLRLLGYAEHIIALYSGFPRLALSTGDAKTLVQIRNEICLS